MKVIAMTTRRKLMLGAAGASPYLAMLYFSVAKPWEKIVSANALSGPQGPANRSLAALERSWVVTRFYSEAMMEDGRVQRDRWEKAKLNAIHGNFDIRDPDNGDLLQQVEKGVRLPPSPSSPPRPSPVH